MLFGSNVLDFAIGLVLVYLLLSTICSFVNERIAAWLNLRANALVFGLHGLIGDYTSALLNHPLVASLGKQSGRDVKTPSYIPSQNFAFALIHTITTADAIRRSFDALEQEIAKMAAGADRDNLTTALADAKTKAQGALQPVAIVNRTGFFKWVPPIRLVDLDYFKNVAPSIDQAGQAVTQVRTTVDGIADSAFGRTTKQAVQDAVQNLQQAMSDPSSIPTKQQLVDLGGLKAIIQSIDDPSLRDALLPLVVAAQGDFDRFQINLQHWFNGAMDRLSGWYKRRTTWIILTIAFVVTVILNGDTFAIGNSLWHNDAARTSSVAAAQKLVAESTPATGVNGNNSQQLPDLTLKGAYNQISSINMPIGYTTSKHTSGQHFPWFGGDWWAENVGTTWEAYVLKLGGWVITALALTLGAHFWFDTLNNLMNLRYAGTPPKGTANEATSGPPSIPLAQ
jgi:hypothetical protein